MQKVLCINYYFPPIPSIGCIRNYQIAKCIAEQNSEVYIITSTYSNNYSSDIFPLTIFNKVYRVNVLDYRKKRTKNKNAFHVDSGLIKKGLFHTVINTSLARYLIGEGGLLYMYLAYKKAKKIIDKEGITHVISSYRPWADHYIAYLIKRRYRNNIYWLADFRDAPKQKNERKIFSAADKISAVSDGVAKFIEQHFEHPVNRLPNAATEAQQHFLINQDDSRNAAFTIAYTGSLYKNRQPIIEFFELIREWVKSNEWNIKLCYAGKDANIWNAGVEQFNLQKYNDNLGIQSQKEAWKIQFRANCNIILSWRRHNDQGILTGKLYEYLEARNPILVLLKGNIDDEWQGISERTDGLDVFYTDIMSRKKAIDRLTYLYKHWKMNQPKLKIKAPSMNWEANKHIILNLLANK